MQKKTTPDTLSREFNRRGGGGALKKKVVVVSIRLFVEVGVRPDLGDVPRN